LIAYVRPLYHKNPKEDNSIQYELLVNNSDVETLGRFKNKINKQKLNNIKFSSIKSVTWRNSGIAIFYVFFIKEQCYSQFINTTPIYNFSRAYLKS